MPGKFELHCHSHYSKGVTIPCEGIPSPVQIIKRAGRLGLSGVAIAPHPFDHRGHGMRNAIKRLDAVEAFNALCIDRVVNRFAEMKAAGLGKPMVCGSDAHTLEMLGTAPNLINAGDPDSLLKEIRRGRTEMVRRYVPVRHIVGWNRQRFEKSYGYMLNYMKKRYSRPRLWISRKLLNTFINSQSNFWTLTAKTSLPIISLYGAFRLVGDL